MTLSLEGLRTIYELIHAESNKYMRNFNMSGPESSARGTCARVIIVFFFELFGGTKD